MLKQKLNWRRPLFFLLLPILLIMVFLGFPLPVAPPPAIKPGQEISTTVKKKKRVRLHGLDSAKDAGTDTAGD